MKIDRVYKNYIIAKDGTTAYPYNVYSIYDDKRGEHVGYGRTLKDCKADIDAGVFDEASQKYAEYWDKLKKIRNR